MRTLLPALLAILSVFWVGCGSKMPLADPKVNLTVEQESDSPADTPAPTGASPPTATLEPTQ